MKTKSIIEIIMGVILIGITCFLPHHLIFLILPLIGGWQITNGIFDLVDNSGNYKKLSK